MKEEDRFSALRTPLDRASGFNSFTRILHEPWLHFVLHMHAF